MRTTLLVITLSILGCNSKDKPASPPAPAPAPTAPAPTPPPTLPTTDAAAASAGIACSAAGMTQVKDKCLSPACSELPPDVTACTTDADCIVSTFASCELDPVGPYYAVNKASHAAVRQKYEAKYHQACEACQPPPPACVAGTCGFKK